MKIGMEIMGKNQLLGRYIQEILLPRRISTIVVFLTNRCNARCQYCFNRMRSGASSDVAEKELSLEEYIEFAGKNGPILRLILGGGEPFFRNDIAEVVKSFYRLSSTRHFSISTNGSMIGRTLDKVGDMAETCRDATLAMEVSIDALGARHDELRRFPGLFDQAIDLCRHVGPLQKQHGNILLVINTTVTEENVDHVPALQKFLSEQFEGVRKEHNIIYDCRGDSNLFAEPDNMKKIALIESLRRNNTPGKGSVPGRGIETYLKELIHGMLLEQRLIGKRNFSCNAGRKIIVLMPDGTVSPCEPFLFEEIYSTKFRKQNIRDFDYDFRKLSKTEEYNEGLRFIRAGGCSLCNWSCSTATSLLFSPMNWHRFFAGPRIDRLHA